MNYRDSESRVNNLFLKALKKINVLNFWKFSLYKSSYFLLNFHFFEKIKSSVDLLIFKRFALFNFWVKIFKTNFFVIILKNVKFNDSKNWITSQSVQCFRRSCHANYAIWQLLNFLIQFLKNTVYCVKK